MDDVAPACFLAGLMVARQIIGAALFDDTHRHQSGWAALFGEGQRPYRFESVRELPACALLMTNLDYELPGLPVTFKTGKFLIGSPHRWAMPGNSQVGSLTSFLGLLGGNIDQCAAKAALSANLFGRVSALSRHYFGIEDFPENTLAKGLRRAFGGCDPVMEKSVRDAIHAATLPYAFCGPRHERRGPPICFVALSLPRIAHAGRTLRTMLPSGRWIGEKHKPPAQSVGEWVEHQQTPVLARVSVSSYDPGFASLYHLGKEKSARRWVTGDELHLLAQFASVKVIEVIKAEAFTVAPLASLLESALQPCNEVSLSTGVFLSNVWRAMCQPLCPVPQGINGENSANPYAPFVRATDRLSCLVEAAQLVKLGFEVYGYGIGRVVAGWHGTREEVAMEIRKTHLIPEFTSVSPNSNVEVTEDPIGIAQEMHLCGDMALIEQADAAMVDLLCSGAI